MVLLGCLNLLSLEYGVVLRMTRTATTMGGAREVSEHPSIGILAHCCPRARGSEILSRFNTSSPRGGDLSSDTGGAEIKRTTPRPEGEVESGNFDGVCVRVVSRLHKQSQLAPRCGASRPESERSGSPRETGHQTFKRALRRRCVQRTRCGKYHQKIVQGGGVTMLCLSTRHESGVGF
jgi:hypothetical protein